MTGRRRRGSRRRPPGSTRTSRGSARSSRCACGRGRRCCARRRRTAPVWMKAAGPGTAFEAGLYALLSEVAPSAVLAPLAVDVERGWMLLPDGGPPVTEVVSAMPAYARLQRTLAGHVDRSCSRSASSTCAPRSCRGASRRRWRRSSPAADRDDLRPARRRCGAAVAEWCEQLRSRAGRADARPQRPARPGTSSPARASTTGATAWSRIRSRSLLVADLPEERDAYLPEFADLAPRAELEATVELAVRVGRIARCLVWQRALDALPPDDSRWRTRRSAGWRRCWTERARPFLRG